MAKPGTDVILANHHTGAIVLARVYEINASGDPTKNRIQFEKRVIPAGEAVICPKVEWAMRLEKAPMLQALMDKGWLSLARRTGEVDFRTQSLSDLTVPPHLQGDTVEDSSKTPKGGRVSAALDRKQLKMETGTL